MWGPSHPNPSFSKGNQNFSIPRMAGQRRGVRQSTKGKESIQFSTFHDDGLMSAFTGLDYLRITRISTPWRVTQNETVGMSLSQRLTSVFLASIIFGFAVAGWIAMTAIWTSENTATGVEKAFSETFYVVEARDLLSEAARRVEKAPGTTDPDRKALAADHQRTAFILDAVLAELTPDKASADMQVALINDGPVTFSLSS